jgi:chromosome segregation ATPase
MNAVIESPLEREIARLRTQADEWAYKCGATEQKLAEMKERCSEYERSLSTIRLWKRNAEGRLEEVMTRCAEREDGMNAEQVESLRAYVAEFLEQE